MQLTYEDKQRIVNEIAESVENHNVVGLVDMHELPAPQLQQIKKDLKDTAQIRMSRRTLIKRGLEQAGDAYTDLLTVDSKQPALIFSDDNPFTLFQAIQDKKSAAPAKEGAVTPTDIVLEPGPTGLPPGPALGELQALGAETQVEDGEITIQNQAIAVEAGETITRDQAMTLNKLDLKPLEVGLDLKAAVEDGVLYQRDMLDIDIEQYTADTATASQHAFNLAVDIGYLTAETIRPLLQRGTTHGKNLAVNAEYLTADTVETLLGKGKREADALDVAADTDAVTVEPGEDEETDESEENDGGASGEDEGDEADESDASDAEEDAEQDEDTETDTDQTQSQSSED